MNRLVVFVRNAVEVRREIASFLREIESLGVRIMAVICGRDYCFDEVIVGAVREVLPDVPVCYLELNDFLVRSHPQLNRVGPIWFDL